MYIAPGFTLITSETIDEDALESWAAVNGGRWRLVEESNYGCRRVHAIWGSLPWMQAQIESLHDKDRAEGTPLLHKPPQSAIDVKLHEFIEDEQELCLGVIRSMFMHWDSYAYDIGAHEWVSVLLRDLLPPERIICFEPLPVDPNGTFGRFYGNLFTPPAH